MRFAYSTNAFRCWKLEDALRAIAGCGFDAVELAAEVPHIWPWGTPPAELKAIRRRIERSGLAVSNINAFTMFWCGDMQRPTWIEPRDTLRRLRVEHTEWALQVAAEVGAPSISTQPGGPLPEGADRNAALARFIDGLRHVADTARKLGVKILVEPEPEQLLETEDDFLWFWEACSDLHDVCGMNFDAGHMVCAGRDLAQAFRKVAHLVRHVHIEDIKGRRHYHLVPGEGDMDFAAFFSALKEADYQGYVSLELYTYQHEPVGAGKRGLSVLRRFAGGD